MISLPALVALLDTIAVAELDNAELRLFKSDFTPAPQMDLATLDAIEADYTGYAAVVVDHVGNAWDNDGLEGVMSFQAGHFQPSGGATANTIYGWYLVGQGTGLQDQLLAVELLPMPVEMNDVADAIDIIPTVRLATPMD